MNDTRVQELMENMNAFRRDTYHRNELLNELLELQREMVTLTFNNDHASTAELKIYDVLNHLEQLNESCGNAAGEVFQRFKEESKDYINLIKKEISGQKGEAKAFKALDSICSDDSIILKNVELEDEDFRSELDAVVIGPNAVTIVEVKNTGKNVHIDEEGKFHKEGSNEAWDFDIAEKMYIKEALLRKALKDADIKDVKIQRIVVFTNNSIRFNNECKELYTCTVGKLPYVINKEGWQSIPEYKMHNIKRAIKAAECTNSYPVELDIEQYKKDFATVMAILENAEVVETENIETSDEKLKRERIKTIVKKMEVPMVMGLGLVGGVAGLVLACMARQAMKTRHS